MSSNVTRPNIQRVKFLSEVIQNQIAKIKFIREIILKFQQNGIDLISKINKMIEDIKKAPKQKIAQPYSLIMNWIISNNSLIDNLPLFFNQSLDEIQKSLDNYTKSLQTKISIMPNSLDSQFKNVESKFNSYRTTQVKYQKLFNDLQILKEDMETLQKNNKQSSSQFQKKENLYKQKKSEYLNIDKSQIEAKNDCYNQISLLSQEEDRFILNCEQLDKEIFDYLLKNLNTINEYILTLSNSLNSLSEESKNSKLEEIDQYFLSKTNSEIPLPSDKDIEKYLPKYSVGNTPTLDFDPFSIIPAEVVFQHASDAAYFIATKKYNGRLDREIKFEKNDLFQLIDLNDDGSVQVLHLESGEIGLVHSQYYEELEDSDFTIIKKIKRIDGPPFRYVFALIEDPQTSSVKCIEANGELSIILKNLLCDIE